MNRNLFSAWWVAMVVFLMMVCGPAAFAEPAAPAAAAVADPLEGGAPEVNDNILKDVFERFGEKLPEAKAPENAPAETPEEKTAREAAEAAAAEAAKNETPEEKAAREEREKLLASETPEEKAAREVKEAEEAARNTIEFSEEQVAYLEEQLAVKTKEMTEQLATATARVAELEAQATAKPAPVPGHLDPILLVDDTARLQQTKTELLATKAWLMENLDGYESKDENKPSYSAAEIRSALDIVQTRLTQVIPATEQLLTARTGWEKPTKEEYPALFDPKTAEHKAMTMFLNAVPNFRLIPNFKMLIGDCLAGEKVRLAKKAKGIAAPQGGKVVVVTKKPAPKLPVGARPGPQSQALSASRAKAGAGKGVPDVAGFVKSGASHQSLVETVSKML